MRRNVIVILVAGLTLSACSYSSQNRRNILATSGQGNAIDVSDRHEFSEEELDYGVQAILDNIDATAPIKDGKKQVLIYVHGGLATYNTSISTADRIKDDIEHAGYYPVFFIWSSNLARAYMQHLFFVRHGRRHAIMGPLTSPFYLVGDLLEGIIHMPGTYYQQTKTLFSSFGNRLRNRQTDARIREEALLVSTADSLTLIRGTDHQGRWAKAGKLGLYVLTLAPKLVLMPIVDGFGQPAFEDMKRRTEAMFRRPIEYTRPFNKDAVDPNVLKEFGSGTGAMAQFLTALEKRIARNNDIEITLVGFSMGTIAANKILRYHPDLPVKNIVYMAAACSIHDFRDTVVPFMRQHKQTCFYNLSLHPKAEARETQWRFLDLAPRGSLLEWVDNFLENAPTEGDRTLGKWTNIMLASHLIPVDVRSRVILKSFDGATPDAPQIHGAFDDFPFWEPSFWGEPAKKE